jgi:hypothetical protein
VLTAPEDAGPEPECLLDVLLVDLPEMGAVDWDALGFGCREPFYKSTLKARLRKTKKRAKASVGAETSVKKQVARAA